MHSLRIEKTHAAFAICPALPHIGPRHSAEARMKPFLDANHPMFRKPWVRWVTALVPLAWGGLELSWGNAGWAFLFCGAGAYAFWALILKGPDQG